MKVEDLSGSEVLQRVRPYPRSDPGLRRCQTGSAYTDLGAGLEGGANGGKNHENKSAALFNKDGRLRQAQTYILCLLAC